MNTWIVSNIKFPPFSNGNYKFWKRKIIMYIKAINPDYMDILENDSFVPRKDSPVHTDEDNRVPQEFIPKNPSEYIDKDKELFLFDTILQSSLVDSLDSGMSYWIKNRVSSGHMWETIETMV